VEVIPLVVEEVVVIEVVVANLFLVVRLRFGGAIVLGQSVD